MSCNHLSNLGDREGYATSTASRGIMSFMLLTAATGLLYPLFIYMHPQVLVTGQAHGSSDRGDYLIAASMLTGQPFHDARYFRGCPSACRSTPQDASSGLAASLTALDPHISIAAALYQADRVAAARNLDMRTVLAIIEQHIERPKLGIAGEPRIDVLALNLALDALSRN